MDSKKEIKSFIKHIVDKYQYSFIPLRLVKDGDVKSGKVPAILNWSKYCDELPDDEEIDSWNIIGEPSGVGICCGEASNLGCIDLDTDDAELTRRLVAVIPNNAARIIGNPKRGGKFLFKLKDFPNDEVIPITKTQIKDTNNRPVIDVFVRTGQIVVPPSIHTLYKNGEKLTYSWKNSYKNGEFPIIDDLPTLTEDTIQALRYTINGMTPSEIVHNVRPGTVDINPEESEGRYNWAKKRMAIMQRDRLDITDAIRTLVTEDIERNGADNMVFRTKVKYTASPEINALYWYSNQLMQNNRCKPAAACETPISLTTKAKVEVDSKYDGWNRPDIPDDSRTKLAPFDISVVPEKWRQLVKDAGDSNSLPYEACFFVLLTQLSSVIGNKRVIQWKKQNKEWREAHNIWSVYVARSGTRKTQLLRTLSEPMRRLQKRINDDYEKEFKEVEKRREVIEPQIVELKKRLKEEAIMALDDGEDGKKYILEIQTQIEALEKSIEINPRRQLVVKSATTEKLLILMQQNQTGIMFVYNELSELLAQFRKKGYETQRQIIMDSWDGLGSASYQTKNSGDVFIDTACASLYGAIQPSIFSRFMNEIYKGQNDDGFWQRPFIIHNDSSEAVGAIDVNFDHNRYHDAYEIFYKAYDVEKSDEPISSSYLAYEEYMEFESRVNNMGFNANNDAVGSFWGKFTGKIVKVASLLEFIKNNGVFPREVSLESFREAMYIMERQIQHIKNVFPEDGVYGLSDVIYMMRSGIIENKTTAYKLSRTHSKYFGDKKMSNELMRELVNRNIIKTKKEKGATVIEISPYIF